MTNQEPQSKATFDGNQKVGATFESEVVWWMTRTIVVLVVAVGWLMPEFYDWTGADQSRPAPIVGWIGLGILITDALMLFALAWLHFTRVIKTGPESILADAGSVGHVTGRWRFSVFQILVATTLVAVFLMLTRVTSVQIACWAVQAAVLAAAVWVAVQFPWTRLWIAWIATLQFGPLIWIFRHASILGLGTGVIAIFTGLPNLVPVAFFMTLHEESLNWVSTLLTTAEFAICVWMSYLGSKRALTSGIVVATLALFSSFVFHALVRG